MSDKSPAPIMREIARPDPLGLQYYSRLDTPAQLLRSESASARFHRDIYDLYADMEDKDAHLYAVLQSRKNGVLARPRKLVAASDSPRDCRARDFVQHALDSLNDLDGSLSALLDAIPRGFAVVEILWKIESGRVLVHSLKSRPQRFFRFDADGNLHLASTHSTLARQNAVVPPFSRLAIPAFPHRPVNPLSHQETQPLPPRKFLVMTHEASPEHPAGRALLAKAYWYYWFKKNNLKFWVLFNEKFGSPTIVGKYRLGATDEERNRLMEVIQSLQNDTGVAVPETIALEFLEARRSGTINTYRDLADWCNDEISKLALGATLTSGEGRRSGSLALGEIHERVRSEYIEADIRALMSVINSQLIRWLVDFNFGEDVPSPRLLMDTADDQNLEGELRVDQELVKIGVPLPLSYFYERYKRPSPRPAERAIRYDDNNLYQYHIQFGVLTINEVRRSLGLAPVSWGDRAPAPISTNADSKSGLIAAPLDETPEERHSQTKIETDKEK